LKTRNHSKSANAGNKPHLGLQATLWAAGDQSRSTEGDLGQEPGDSLHRDLDEDLKADFTLANPPSNADAADHERLAAEAGPGRRFPPGLPRADHANYLWIELFHSAPNGKGRAGFVMANSASDARLVECSS
jgi:type I restriction-modification system DNA methylase subunit